MTEDARFALAHGRIYRVTSAGVHAIFPPRYVVYTYSVDEKSDDLLVKHFKISCPSRTIDALCSIQEIFNRRTQKPKREGRHQKAIQLFFRSRPCVHVRTIEYRTRWALAPSLLSSRTLHAQRRRRARPADDSSGAPRCTVDGGRQRRAPPACHGLSHTLSGGGSLSSIQGSRGL